VLSHYLEDAGLATTQISLVREVTEIMRPPRVLWVTFPLGRPFGPANDPAFQTRVLRAALDLLDAPAGPVLADFPEDMPGAGEAEGEEAMEGMVCPIELPPPPGADSGTDGVETGLRKEIALLRPWYDLALEKSGRTTVGVSGLDIDGAADFLLAFIKDPSLASPRDDLDASAYMRAVYEDVKSFYLEAAAAQPGQASIKQVEDWLWGETAFASAVLSLRQACIESDDPSVIRVGQRNLVPRMQAHRLS